ncbi:MAG TPA: glutamate-5-semialdehyde dehydrogenase, partial [Phycisphaerales bacterium]|nr:glutamate-5-semialdehyde dehydrogenase [Phycisphaerales bacterium]
PTEVKNQALCKAAELIRANEQALLEANAVDVEKAKEAGVKGSFLDRLELTPTRVEGMAKGLEQVAQLPDPVGRKLAEWDRPNGIKIARVAVPLGVIGVIYESRPNVTADAGALCLKAGNAVILRCGSDSVNSSRFIAKLMGDALEATGLPRAVVTLVPTQDREAVGVMLGLHGLIDVIVPRGGRSLIERVVRDSKIPTFEHLDGNCHTYIHTAADPNKAKEVVRNAKLRRTGICGATESLLIDRDAVESFLPMLVEAMPECEFRGDEECRRAVSSIKAASEEDWGTEYLAPILSVKAVGDIQEAIEHVNRFGSGHTDCILTEDLEAAEHFLKGVDSAIVMHNASTQFADGGEFGMGAEIGIATGRLHARGPVGVDQLTTYKYQVRGNGQTRPA